jgi:hypothetical protein
VKPVEIILRSRGGGIMEGANLIYIVSTYINVTMKPPVQLTYANKKENY